MANHDYFTIEAKKPLFPPIHRIAAIHSYEVNEADSKNSPGNKALICCMNAYDNMNLIEALEEYSREKSCAIYITMEKDADFYDTEYRYIISNGVLYSAEPIASKNARDDDIPNTIPL
jgi:hypothetical protein